MKRRPGPFVRVNIVTGKIDGRTLAAKISKRVRADLTEHVGGAPSATQRMLIERAVQLQVQLEALDLKIAGSSGLTDHDSNQYLAWSNSMTRTLQALGMQGVKQRQPTLAEYKASRAATASAA